MKKTLVEKVLKNISKGTIFILNDLNNGFYSHTGIEVKEIFKSVKYNLKNYNKFYWNYII